LDKGKAEAEVMETEKNTSFFLCGWCTKATHNTHTILGEFFMDCPGNLVVDEDQL